MAGSLLVALLVALGLLSCLELGARAWLSNRELPHSYSEPRNPSFRRGWGSFTQPRDRDRQKPLVIVVGNSQGFLREEADGELAYPARLAAGLRESGVDAIVANWSVPGGRGPEMIVLAARAAQHSPDLVVLSAGTRAFGTSLIETEPLSYWVSDVTDMAYEPEVRWRLPRTFLDRHGAREALPFLRSRSAIVAMRGFLEARPERWTWEIEPALEPSRKAALDLEEPDLRLLRALLVEFSSALRAPGSELPLLVVNMPIDRARWLPAAYARSGAFSQEAQELFATDPRTTVLDARAVVPGEHFATATHLTPAGHQLYADWLRPYVLEALGAPPLERRP